MQTEQWQPVAGFEGVYSVSNLGRVRSEPRVIVYATGKRINLRGRILRPATKARGHQSVCLYRGASAVRAHVHRLVLIAFVGEPPSPLHEGAHNDGEPKHNAVSNLRWATRSENHRDKVAHGTHNRGDRHPNKKVTDAQVRAIRSSQKHARVLAKEYGLTWQYVYAIKSNKTRRFS
jgi:hypothetical protein